MKLPEGWESVIGLEVHAELLTATKLFSASPNRFGGEPNTHIDPVSLGLPGTLPVINRHAVELAIRVGLALNCDVRPSTFARKNYFYPDMPKNYQISQYDRPVSVDGELKLPDGSTVGIERAHIEEDTGKTTHAGGAGRIQGAAYSLVDYNRAGVPLVEVVSRPHMRTAEQARAFVKELRSIVLAVGVSDARMQEGSMRVDANVSVRPVGADDLRTRCEIKNLSSVRSLGRAVVHEARRQVGLWEAGGAPLQQTRHWDERRDRTVAGRSKEESEDYRYFPDPDLAPLAPSAADIAAADAALPQLPAERREALTAAADGAVAAETAALLVQRGQDGLVVGAVEAGADPERTATRVVNDLAVDDWSSVTPQRLAGLMAMETAGRISAAQAKQVLAGMLESGDTAEAVAARRGFGDVGGGELSAAVAEVLADNPDEWRRYREGDDVDRKKMAGFLTGQVMRATRGRADGAAVAALLRQHAAGRTP